MTMATTYTSGFVPFVRRKREWESERYSMDEALVGKPVTTVPIIAITV